MNQEILYAVKDGVGRITFNRPEARNAFTFRMYERLVEICKEATSDSSVKVLLLTGADEKAFAAGTDISEFKNFTTPQHALDYEARINALLDGFERIPIPTIAAISGFCTGGGSALAACCDLRIGSANARFGVPIARTLGNCISVHNVARLIAAFGGAVGFGMAAGASYVALALYSRLRVESHTLARDGQHVLRQFVEGLSFVGNNFVFASLIALALFNSLFGLSYVTLLPIFADWYFGARSTGYGMLNAAHGVGALVGTLTIATLAQRIARPGTTLLVGAAGLGFLLMTFSRAPTMAVALPALVLVGFSNTFYLTQVSTFIQQGVPDHLRGRVLSLYSLCWNLLPIGGLLAGVLAAAVDARFAILFGGGVVAANALLLLTSARLRAIGRRPGLSAAI
jgi:hypothetical protein